MNMQDSAATYLLAALLPRLEELRPGLVDELMHGVKADKDSAEKSGQTTPEADAVFRSAERILGLALQR